MFIPLTINQRKEGLKNIALIGDTAGIFWILSQMTEYPVNMFLCDTGIKRPLREFPCHRGTSKDRANVYYDFFDARVGGGIPRRMDAVIMTDSLMGAQDAFAACRIGGTALQQLERTNDGGVQYKTLNGKIKLEPDGIKIRRAKPDGELTETNWSAWDRANEVLGNNECIQQGHDFIMPDEERRLIEMGIPELDILTIRHADGQPEYRELAGDLARVFDGLFEK